MATLTVQQAPVTGLAQVAFVAAEALGDDVPTGADLLLIRNGDVSSHTATIATPGTVRGLAIEDPDVVVAAGDIAIVPMAREVFGVLAAVTYDDVTSVDVAAIRLV